MAEVFLFRQDDGSIPVLEWLTKLNRRNPDAVDRCYVAIRRLAAFGHALRRPHADSLRDGIHELRLHEGRVQIRILYFFHGKQVVVLASGFTKEDKVPPREIERALEMKRRVEADADPHSLLVRFKENVDE